VIDTLSVTDIVGVLYDKCAHMDLPVAVFLSSTRRTKVIKVCVGERGVAKNVYIFLMIFYTFKCMGPNYLQLHLQIIS
jgi:hypothetical protein